MNKKEYKNSVYALLNQDVDGLGLIEKLNLTKSLLIEFQKDSQDLLDTSNKGRPWTDEELEIILMAAPTKENCAHFARLFKRGYGSIEQIYRWAVTSSKVIERRGRDQDAFVQQVKRIAKKVGFCAG